MADVPLPGQNRLPAALPEEVRSRLFGQLELVALALDNVLYESGDTLRHVYFPTDSIIIPALRDEARCVGGDLCSRQQRADPRCAVTIAAGALQRKSLIRYNRGDIEILSRKGLEATACECYAAVIEDYAQLFP